MWGSIMALTDSPPASSLDDGDDRRARVQSALRKRGLSKELSAAQAAESWRQERFVARARALFYARMMFLSIGLLILAVPVWTRFFGISGPGGIGVYFVMLMYSVANYTVLANPRAGRIVTYITLCLDLTVMVVLIARGGGLSSPLLATQLLFTTLFALLFPKPLAILPPLLALLISTRLDQLLDRSPTAIDVLTLLWFLALDFIIIYVLVYLNEREVAAHREVVELQTDLKELAVLEERNRLAREIHDGLGASLSSLIIQSEYLQSLAKDPSLLDEIAELKSTAEESIEELRRNLQMMREDFDLANGLEDYVKTFRDRTQLNVAFTRSGTLIKASPEAQLALFRVLQECLSNAAKHAGAKAVEVKLHFAPEAVHLSVGDDGKGFDLNAKRVGHYGLINMRERANKVTGSVIIDSAPGKGTRITFSVPLSA
jgi:two-component system, NarL family, sensor histidine kinase DegS